MGREELNIILMGEWTDDRWHKGVEIFRQPHEGDPEPFAKCDTICGGGRNGRVIICGGTLDTRRNEMKPLPHLKQDETVFGGTIASGTIVDPRPFLYLQEWAENNHSDMGGGVK